MFSFIRRRKRRTLVAGGGVLALVIAGTAFALWNMTQSTNTFQGKTGTVTLSFATPVAGDFPANSACVPSGSCPIVAEVTNPTAGPIAIYQYAASVNGGYGSTNCPATNFATSGAESTTTTSLTPTIPVPANATNFAVVLPNALTLNATAPTACQSQSITPQGGATISVSFTAGS